MTFTRITSHSLHLQHWWAWYYSMALYASIFAFLVFLLQHWLTTMHGTDTMPYASCAGLHDHLHSKLIFCQVFIAHGAFYLVTSRRHTSDPQLGWYLVAWTMLITLSAIHVLAIFPFKGKSSATPLTTVFPHLYIVWCHTFPNSFSNISQCTQHALGQAWLVIWLVTLPGTQVRQFVFLEL